MTRETVLAVAKSPESTGFVLDGFLPGARILSVRSAAPSVGFYVEVEGDRKPVRRQCRHRDSQWVTNGTMRWEQAVPCRRIAGASGYCSGHEGESIR